MRVILVTADGRSVPLRAEPTRAVAACRCPSCERPLFVRGDGRRVSRCDRYYVARGYCTECDALVGEIRAYPATLFGIEEDERVLNGRTRVY